MEHEINILVVEPGKPPRPARVDYSQETFSQPVGGGLAMQDGLLYFNLLLKMYLMSLKSSGVLLLNDYLPHTVQTIATFTRHQAGTVERALKIFQEFGLVEILTDGACYMSDIQVLIGQSSSEGERKKKERMRLKRQNLLPSGETDICPSNGRVDKCPPILEYRDKEIRDKRIERGTVH